MSKKSILIAFAIIPSSIFALEVKDVTLYGKVALVSSANFENVSRASVITLHDWV
tara:strand:- start:13546 stop:13710 length:165 start_codon:yes stop_codon:yes gene_type:complete